MAASRSHVVLGALVAVGMVASLYAASQRFRSEFRNRRAELAVDYGEAARLGAAAGIAPVGVLRRLRDAGAGAVAVTEDTLQSLTDAGAVTRTATGAVTSARVRDAATLERIVRNWRSRGVRQASVQRGAGGPSVLLWCGAAGAGDSGATATAGFAQFEGSLAALASLGVGLPPEALEDTRAAGMRCVARTANFAGASAATMPAVLRDLGTSRAESVVFSGTEVFGHYGAHKEAAAAFDASGVLFGQVEFGKQKGDERLGGALRGGYVRVHSISEAEMGTLSEDDAVDRFVRAVRERNVRLCYVRLVTFAGEDPLERNARYVTRIARGIGRGGLFTTGAVRLFADPRVPSWVFTVAGLGAGALGAWLVTLTVPGARQRPWWWVILVPMLCALAAGSGETGRKLAALVAALSAPTLACLPLVAMLDGAGAARQHAGVAWRCVRILVLASLVTSAGVVSVVGLLASRPFMMKASQFLGIKAAHALPILMIGLLLITGMPGASDSAKVARERMAARMRAFLAQPVAAGAIVGSLVLLVVLMLVVVRTGNDPGVGVSGFEMRARALLDVVLPIRPRTKEFLLGHPAFILAVGFAALGRRRVAAIAALLGVMGQVSILNTFCHIHTPLVLSAMRVVVGLVAGTVLGLGLLGVAAYWTGRTQSAAAPAGQSG